MATKRGCKMVGKAAPRTRSGPCGPKLKKAAKKPAKRKSSRKKRK